MPICKDGPKITAPILGELPEEIPNSPRRCEDGSSSKNVRENVKKTER